MCTQSARRHHLDAELERPRLETRDPDESPIDAPYEDLDDPDLVPEEDDEYLLPDEDEEYASPGVEPHEEPLVTP